MWATWWHLAAGEGSVSGCASDEVSFGQGGVGQEIGIAWSGTTAHDVPGAALMSAHCSNYGSENGSENESENEGAPVGDA